MKHVMYGLLLLSIIAFIGCEAGILNGDNPDEPAENRLGEYDDMEEIQLASGDVVYKTKDGKYVIQGDVLLSQQQVDELNSPGTRAALIDGYRWPDEKIYYKFRDGMSDALQANIHLAMQHWEEKTPFKFYERTNQPNYVEFYRSNNNSSYYGMVGGMQDIQLTYDASVGTIIHEIGHAVGLLHEQCRSDRDQFINVNYSNIKESKLHNFDIFSKSHSVTSEFDFNSIMIYPSVIKNTRFVYDLNIPTMTKKDGATWVAQNDSLSALDQQKINQIFGKAKDQKGNYLYFFTDFDTYGRNNYRGDTGYFYEGDEVYISMNTANLPVGVKFSHFMLNGLRVENGYRFTLNQDFVSRVVNWKGSVEISDWYSTETCRLVLCDEPYGSQTKTFLLEATRPVDHNIKCVISHPMGSDIEIEILKGQLGAYSNTQIPLNARIRIKWFVDGVEKSNGASYLIDGEDKFSRYTTFGTNFYYTSLL